MDGRPLWHFAAALYFVFVGMVSLFSLSFDGLQFAIAFLAFAAGILLFLNR